jgi:nucleoside-diphosphate-sugar epimerase|tara:strand:+ start:125 stop:256 length:132 start_codon:yes stop_codon:yes gene_type:complete
MINKNINLITGVAGFIGFSFALKFLKVKKKVLGVERFKSYYKK